MAYGGFGLAFAHLNNIPITKFHPQESQPYQRRSLFEDHKQLLPFEEFLPSDELLVFYQQFIPQYA